MTTETTCEDVPERIPTDRLYFKLNDREVTGSHGFNEKARFSEIEKALLNGESLMELSWTGIVQNVYLTVYDAVGQDRDKANRVCPVWAGWRQTTRRDGRPRLGPPLSAKNALRFIVGAFQSKDSIVQDALKSIRIEIRWKLEEKRAAHPGCSAVFEYERGHHETEGAESYIRTITDLPFELTDESADLKITKRTQVERDNAFHKLVIMAYGNECAFCQGGLRLDDTTTELEAAHIKPRSQRGPNDIRNGLALCRSHHWAFDNGLMTIGENGTIRISARVEKHPRNMNLVALVGKTVSRPDEGRHAPHEDALRWHRENIFLR